METRISFCVVLDALGVFTLICAGLSLAGASWLGANSITIFGWLFISAIALFSVARVCEILRVVWKTPSAVSMRAISPAVSATGSEQEQPERSDFPRAA